MKLRAGKPMTFPRTERPSPALAATVTDRIWPNIELQWEWLGGLPPLRKAAVIGAGSWGTAVAVLLARGGLEVELGTRTDEQGATRSSRSARTSATCPGSSCPRAWSSSARPRSSSPAATWSASRCPRRRCRTVVGGLADRIGSRASVLLLSKGLVQPMGALPNDYVSERVRARAIASLGGPAHAREAAAGMAALVLGSADADLRAMLGEVFDRAGLVCERTDDVAGVEIAGAAKNAAALAAAAAERFGLNAAGIAAAGVWRECVEFALSEGRPARDLHRPRRGRRPDRDRARAEEPQPPGRRAARRRACRPRRSAAASARPRRGSTRCR